MAMRCPECAGRGEFFSYDPSVLANLIGTRAMLFKWIGKCRTCRGTGWKIPSKLPESVASRLGNQNSPNRYF